MIYQRSGQFLGIARRFIQRKFPNGEFLTWGSQEESSVALSPYDIEKLSQDLAESVLQSVLKEVDVCDSFVYNKYALTEEGSVNGEKFYHCNVCGFTKNLHDLKKGEGHL
jgi:hypothetical protein